MSDPAAADTSHLSLSAANIVPEIAASNTAPATFLSPLLANATTQLSISTAPLPNHIDVRATLSVPALFGITLAAVLSFLSLPLCTFLIFRVLKSAKMRGGCSSEGYSNVETGENGAPCMHSRSPLSTSPLSTSPLSTSSLSTPHMRWSPSGIPEDQDSVGLGELSMGIPSAEKEPRRGQLWRPTRPAALTLALPSTPSTLGVLAAPCPYSSGTLSPTREHKSSACSTSPDPLSAASWLSDSPTIPQSAYSISGSYAPSITPSTLMGNSFRESLIGMFSDRPPLPPPLSPPPPISECETYRNLSPYLAR